MAVQSQMSLALEGINEIDYVTGYITWLIKKKVTLKQEIVSFVTSSAVEVSLHWQAIWINDGCKFSYLDIG